jgi:predicted nucleic acid-binding protein
LRFVIDSNEYIFAFGPLKEHKARQLLDRLLNEIHLHTIRIPHTIFEEVKRNLSPEAFQEFNNFVNAIGTVDEDITVPFEIVFKYEAKHLKPADAFIAAYTEWTGADVLVTENRHFLIHQDDLSFKVLAADTCLKFLRSSVL